MSIIRTENLSKIYRSDFYYKKFVALNNLSLSAPEGGIFGLIGPNGAGKTTTIKILTGLIYASSGEAYIFEKKVGNRKARSRFGFLPENPVFYDYLTGREVLHLLGRLCDLPKDLIAQRTEELIKLVGLGHAGDRQVRKYSKGMAQRLGLAQALINDPELVILDEPMSGLDPIGRREVRDIILHLSEQGKTIFFSTHILSDVEMICDQIAILNKGRKVGQGTVADLLASTGAKTSFDFEVEGLSQASSDRFGELIAGYRRVEEKSFFSVDNEKSADEVIDRLRAEKVKIKAIYPNRVTLEDIFLSLVNEGGNGNE